MRMKPALDAHPALQTIKTWEQRKKWNPAREDRCY